MNPLSDLEALPPRLESIDRCVQMFLDSAPSAVELARTREAAAALHASSTDPIEKAKIRAFLFRWLKAPQSPEQEAEARSAARDAAALAGAELRPGGARVAVCSNEDARAIAASLDNHPSAGPLAADLMRQAIDHGLDIDANALLGRLGRAAMDQVVADLKGYAEDTSKDPFLRFRAFMILFGIHHQDASEEGGTVYIKTSIPPSAEAADAFYRQAQTVYIEAIERKLAAALSGSKAPKKTAKKEAADSLPAPIPAAMRGATVTAKTGLRIELDSCVGNDHVLVSQDIGARIIHVSILLRDADTGREYFPITIRVRGVDEPVLMLSSVDRRVGPVRVETVEDLYNLEASGANDSVRLSKAAFIATFHQQIGPARRASASLRALLDALGGGIAIETHVQGVPVGSGMGTSSALAGAILAALAKFTGQTRSPGAKMDDEEKMLCVARTLLVEQLIGALGGWQDPCAIFPGVKLLTATPGQFLPDWKPIAMPPGSRETLIRTLKLTDGAYRQPSQAAAWQFAGLWVMRLESVYEARMNSRRLFEQQVASLEAGAIERVGPVEWQDWMNRCIISPKATNLYIERVVALMREAFGPENIHFDACGARGGAGGCFWIDSEAIPAERFEREFQRLSAQAIAELKDRIRFEGAPRVYDYAINDEGLELEVSR